MNGKSASASANSEGRREKGLSLIVIGIMVWFFDALIFFFMPAGVKLGQQQGFGIVIGSALLIGAILIGVGVYMRREGSAV
jgi:polyferredoxin